jgi:hypothetical protein
VDIYPALERDIVVFQILGKAQQDTHGQLVVQKTALQITGSRSSGSGFEADKIARKSFVQLFRAMNIIFRKSEFI